MIYNVSVSCEKNSSNMNNIDLFMLNGVLRNVVYNLEHNDEYDDRVTLVISRSIV